MVRRKLTRPAIVAAAVGIADAEGLTALSMRRLAETLGVEAMSLYNHVGDKNDLHRAMVGSIWAAVDLAEDAADGRTGLRRTSESTYRSLCAHPWFFSLSLPDNGGTERIAVIEATLRHLEATGLDAARRFHALHVLDGFVYGFAWQATEFASSDAVPGPAHLEELLAPFPRVRAHAADHGDPSNLDGFGVGFDALLDGLGAASAR